MASCSGREPWSQRPGISASPDPPQCCKLDIEGQRAHYVGAVDKNEDEAGRDMAQARDQLCGSAACDGRRERLLPRNKLTWSVSRLGDPSPPARIGDCWLCAQRRQ
ncbi:uncharacterized protein SPSK_10096 [Sporothrix schenckii 1099-18]|uniref:Uncharacterized protein n=1 Tax=Sporothrix schenckii 1099-18 TaxID=1397361 RepID=A0A0F2M6U0_SPOSC|nr:uncharacterized protein SPSK_10096 [Sporothrix schenckii 1099-18]KJR84799.1 hypothetical protein SPSK_10096 [Sporothrix schenckii 1099-18]